MMHKHLSAFATMICLLAPACTLASDYPAFNDGIFGLSVKDRVLSAGFFVSEKDNTYSAAMETVTLSVRSTQSYEFILSTSLAKPSKFYYGGIEFNRKYHIGKFIPSVLLGSGSYTSDITEKNYSGLLLGAALGYQLNKIALFKVDTKLIRDTFGNTNESQGFTSIGVQLVL